MCELQNEEEERRAPWNPFILLRSTTGNSTHLAVFNTVQCQIFYMLFPLNTPCWSLGVLPIYTKWLSDLDFSWELFPFSPSLHSLSVHAPGARGKVFFLVLVFCISLNYTKYPNHKTGCVIMEAKILAHNREAQGPPQASVDCSKY